MSYSVADLRAFEDSVAEQFAAGKISAPIHLSGGNELQLIEIFRSIDIANDYVLCGWRSHPHALLKGVPSEYVMQEILAGRSVSLIFPEHKFFCSGIVGGIAPIATGLAWAEKQKADASPTGQCARVHVFLGDMAAESGVVHEAMKYADGHALPINWIIEDNGLSVGTSTVESWGRLAHQEHEDKCVTRYRYELTQAHSGVGKWVNFK